eukprot:44842-Pelagomonas_calceolata.AAC.4
MGKLPPPPGIRLGKKLARWGQQPFIAGCFTLAVALQLQVPCKCYKASKDIASTMESGLTSLWTGSSC